MKKLLCLSIFFGILAIVFKIYCYKTFFFDQLNVIVDFKANGWKSSDSDKEFDGIFTEDQLNKYNGLIKKELYLSILGEIYDVSAAEIHYGPGKSYHIFIGKDASKSFINGKFDENDVSDDVSDLNPEDLLMLKKWKEFYDEKYPRKGVLVGRYFDSSGQPTQYSKIVEDLIKKAEKLSSEKNLEEHYYPPCNIEWNPDTGTRVWCTNKSGGVSRDWVGFPRKYIKPGSNSVRCACINIKNDENDPKINQYENCDDKSVSCFIKT